MKRYIRASISVSDMKSLMKAALNVVTEDDLNKVLSSLKLYDNKMFLHYSEMSRSGEYSVPAIGKMISDDLYWRLDDSIESSSKVQASRKFRSWTDVYEEFNKISDKYFDGSQESMERINDYVLDFYEEHKGDPSVEEAYRRWNEPGWEDEEEAEQDKEILYVIKDRNGRQLSSPNKDDGELWDRVSDMEARGRRGLSVVVYNP